MKKKLFSKKLIISLIIGIAVIIVVHVTSYLLEFSSNSQIIWTVFNSIIQIVIAVIAAIYGPVIGLVLGIYECIIRYSQHDFSMYYWRLLISPDNVVYLLYGVSVGAISKYLAIGKKALTIQKLVIFNIVQIVATILFRSVLYLLIFIPMITRMAGYNISLTSILLSIGENISGHMGDRIYIMKNVSIIILSTLSLFVLSKMIYKKKVKTSF